MLQRQVKEGRKVGKSKHIISGPEWGFSYPGSGPTRFEMGGVITKVLDPGSFRFPPPSPDVLVITSEKRMTFTSLYLHQ